MTTLDPEVLARLRETMTPLDLGRHGAAGSGDAGALDTYLDYYGLRPEGYEHRFGTFRSAGHVIAANVLLPPSPRGTVMVLHGLFDHTGTLAATIRHVLGLGFAVAAYDLPGHGLSSGRRASIEDFGVYAEVLDTFLGLIRAHMPAPYHAIAHSTGAAILVTRLLGHQDTDIEHVVLVAPLVRSAHWVLSTAGGQVVGTFLDEVPRVFRDNTSDEAFQSFVRADPLQPRSTSLRWLMALIEWNERIERYPPSERPIVVIQGDQDDVVDWEYNIAFLGERFPRARIELIEGGRHQLLGESPQIRAVVTRLIDEALTAPADVARPPGGG